MRNNQNQANNGLNNQSMTGTNPYINSNNSMNQGQDNNGFNSQTMTGANPYINPNNSINQNLSNTGFSTTEILTGALIGAAATYILTNENVQKTIFKGMVSIGDILSGGMDEIKERFEDAKAEYEAEKEA